MAKYDGSIKFDTKIDERGFIKGVGKLNNTGNKLLSGLGTLAKGTAIAVTGIGIAATKVGSDFESAMSRVGALSNATGAELQQLKDTAKQLGKDTVFSASQAAEGMQYLAMAGFKTNEIIASMPGLLSLASAGQVELGTAADITSNILSGFNMEAEQSGHAADVLTYAFTNSNTSLESLGETMKYVAPVAAAAGFSLEETAAAAGILGDAGIQGGQAGTALRAIMLRLIDPPKQAAEALNELGVEILDANKEMKPLADIIAELELGMKDMTKAEQTAIASQIAGKEAASGLLAIISQGSGTLREFTDELENSGGTADRVAEQQLENLKGKFELLKSVLEGLGIAIYENLAGPLTNVVESITKYMDILLSTIETMQMYVEATGDVEGALDRVATVMMNIAIKALESFAEAIPQALQLGTTMIEKLLEGFASKSEKITQIGFDIVNELINSLTTLIPQMINTGVKIVSSLGKGMKENSSDLAASAIDLLVAIGDSIISNIPIIIQAGLDIIIGLAKGIADNLPTLIEEVPRLINEFSSAIYAALPEILKAGFEIIVVLAKGLIQAIPTLVSNIPQIIKAIINVFTLTNWAKIGIDLITKIGQGISSIGPNLVQLVKNIGNNIFDTIRYILNGGGVKLIGKNLLTGIMSGIQGMVSGIVSLVKGIGTSIVNTIKGVFTGNAGKIGSDLVKGLWNGIANVQGWILEKIQGFANSITSGLKSFFGIKSPSRKMRDEVGVWLPRGIGEGIKKETPALQKLTEKEMDKLVSDYGRHGENAIKEYGKLSKKELDKLKKEHKNDGEALTKAIADGQKAKMNEVAAALDKIRDEQIKHLDKLGEATMTALKRQYEAEEREQIKHIDKRIANVEKESQEKIKIYEKELAYKIQLLDAETNAEVKALQDKIDAINKKTEEEERAIKEQEYQDKLQAEKDKLLVAKTEKEKSDIQKNIDEMIAARERDLELEKRKQQIEDIKNEINNIKDKAQQEKEELEKEYKNKMDNEKDKLESAKQRLNDELEATKQHYEVLLKEENLQAEARRLMLDENNQELVNLLESYNPDWHDAGQSFGQSLLDGLNSMKYQIEDVVDDIMSSVATADMANARIIQAKLDYEAARKAGDKEGMEHAHKRAERYRNAGGNIGSDTALNLDKYSSQLDEISASQYKRTLAAEGNKENSKGITQNITIVSPQNTPYENARQMKLKGGELLNGY